MARIARKYILTPGLAIHKVWRGHNREFNIGDGFEKRTYLNMLNEELIKQTNILHAVCLMSNHSHEMYQLGVAENDITMLSELFRRHHSRYGMYFNRKNKRSGKVAESRPFTCSVEPEDAIEMEVTFYIHANPIRAGICKDAKDYLYSTHRLYAYGKREPWMKNIIFPEWYMRLGSTMQARQKKYRQLFDAYLRKYGHIKVSHNIYGWGSILWVLDRKKQIRALVKNAPPD